MWEIRRSKLIAGLQLLDLIPEKVGLSSSEFFWIRGKGDKVIFSVASYTMGETELVGHGKWDSRKDFFIDRRVFLPFVYASKAIKNKNTFKFSIHKDQLQVQHGSRKAAFTTQKDIKGYGNLKRLLKEKENTIPVTDEMIRLLKCGQRCAVSDAIEPSLNCVFVSKGKVIIEAAAASARMYFLGTGKIDKKHKIHQSIPFPLSLVDLLSEESLKKVSWRGNYIVLEFEKGIIWQGVSKEALDKFPLKTIKKHSVNANKLQIVFTVSSRRLSKVMVRLGYYLQAADKRDWVVQIRGKEKANVLQLTTSIPSVKFVEKIPISGKLKKDIKIDWPLDSLKAVFEFLSVNTKKLGLIVRMDKREGVSYITAGSFWFTVTSKKES